MDQLEIPRYVRRKEAARMLGVSEGTMRNWAASSPRKGPVYHRIGSRAVAYLMDDLLAFAAAGRVETSGVVA